MAVKVSPGVPESLNETARSVHDGAHWRRSGGSVYEALTARATAFRETLTSRDTIEANPCPVAPPRALCEYLAI